jgi:predicted component of type VI protein secretion system
MAENVIYGVGATSMPIETNVALGPLPQNKTMVVQKLTNDEQPEPELVKGLENMEMVFEKFQPKIEIDFLNEDGSTTGEEIKYNKLTDFQPSSIIAQSPHLTELKSQAEEYNNISTRIKSNASLQKLLSDPDQKDAFLGVLNNLIKELQDSI